MRSTDAAAGTLAEVSGCKVGGRSYRALSVVDRRPPASKAKAGGRPAYAAAPRSLMEPPIAGHDKSMWRSESEQLGSSFNLTDQH